MIPVPTEQDALLAAILAHPAEDTPRLMYADWLDEHGEHARAEFIRVQCGLARYPAGESARHHPVCLGPRSPRCRWCDLRRRERELWDAHAREWFSDGRHGLSVAITDAGGAVSPGRIAVGSLKGDPLIVRRGWPDEARAPLAVLERVLPDLCGRHPVTLAVATDREPDGEATTAPLSHWWRTDRGDDWQDTPLFHWWRTDRGDDWQDTPEYLPGNLFDMLPGYPVADAGEWRKGFDTYDIAIGHLSAVILQAARHRQ